MSPSPWSTSPSPSSSSPWPGAAAPARASARWSSRSSSESSSPCCFPVLPSPEGLALRFAELAAAFVLLTLGVAGYLATRTGAGPAEAAALAFDPPLAFRWSYTVLQVGGALGGWALGAAVGPGTLITALLVGPAVDLTTRTVFRGSGSLARPSTQASLPEPC